MREKKIMPTAKTAGWVEARRLTENMGGLPSNVLHDHIVVGSKDRTGQADCYPAWAREVLVYPAKGVQFTTGADVVDSANGKGKDWVFPAICIPREAFGRDNVGLFVDPEDVEVTPDRIVVLAKPESVTVLSSFIQNARGSGNVDSRTGVPLGSDVPLMDERRVLHRLVAPGVRPIVRYHFASGFYNRISVDAGFPRTSSG
jgi:hypothetical protein